MGRSLDEVVAGLPEARRARVEARAEELREEVESLGELRRLAGKAPKRRPKPKTAARTD